MGATPPLLSESDLDTLASDFLQSHYLGSIYAEGSPERRRDRGRRRRGLARVANDGDLSHNVLERIMARGRVTLARRCGPFVP